MKNTQNLINKKNKIKAEILFIQHYQPMEKLTLYGGKNVSRKEVLQIKYNQLKILKFLLLAQPAQIQRKLNSVKAKMCNACQKRIQTGDLQCRKDFENMIFCNMAYQAIIQEAV